jgi:superfamily II DNA or RNA helicase
MMSANYSKIENQRQQLVISYQNLAELDRSIVQLISVIYTPVSRTMILTCLEHAKISGDKPLSAATLKPFIDRLLSSQILRSIGKHSIQIDPLIAEIATRDAVRAGRFGAINAAINQHLPIAQYGSGVRNFSNESEFIREIRLGLYGNDLKFIKKQFDEYHRYGRYSASTSLEYLWQQTCNNPFDADWFATLIPDLAGTIIESILNYSLQYLTPADAAFAALPATIDRSTQSMMGEHLQRLLVEQSIVRGKLAQAKELLERLPVGWRDSPPESLRQRFAQFWGWYYFLHGDDNSAIPEYEIALRAVKKNSGKHKIFFVSISGLFFILALIRRSDGEDLRTALEHVKVAIQAKSWLSSAYSILEDTIEMQMGKFDRRDSILGSTPLDRHHSIEILIRSLCIHWVDKKAEHKQLPHLLEQLYSRSSVAGYDWLAMEAAGILSHINPTEKFQSFYQKRSVALQKEIGITNLSKLIQAQELWELSLTALTNIQPSNVPAKIDRVTGDRRLIWAIIMYGSTHQIQPREQTRNAKGEWSKGRNIALKRLRSSEDIEYLTPEDLRVCEQLQSYNTNGWGHNDYRFSERAIVSLIGHPLVFWEDNPTTRIEIIGGEPELKIINVKDERIVLSMFPELEIGKNVLVQKESPSRLKAILITDEHRRIAEILGKQNRLEVPIAAKSRVLAAIGSISSVVTIHSDIGGGATNVEEVPSDPQPYIHLLPNGMGLKVTLLSRPFAPAGPYYSPGTGGETVIAEIEGKRLQTHRDLAAERRFANAIVASCPTLEQMENLDDEWLVEDPQECLELLVELQAVTDIAMVEWPEGEKMRVSRQAGLGDFQLRIQRENDWFATTGTVQVDDDRVLELQQLLALLDGSPSRFIPLGDGQFLTLTEEFRQRLDELRGLSERHGKGFRMHPLAALTMEDWLDDVGQLKADKHWQSHIQKLREVESLEPQLPSTLQAELRDYQVDGFRWLARLAHWGVGACLADDMGLGKTLQSLALILTRAAAGATLIIAPTSVCMNWVSEAEKFAPTLNPIQFGSGNREQVLERLQPFDLVVCSYGLLQQDDVGEMLAKIQWQTIVLDEAQSIKNFATKRSQAAMNLQGGFKLIVTGTPIENHLGELWNLFRFINPGLLGSLDNFNLKFANSIERDGERSSRHQLKKLIQPFILRRLKSQVLSELPSRTEITLQVELSKEEMAFYEALRQQAIFKLTDSDAPPGQKHLQVLAEIMKLRQACCNPKLVTTDIAIPSAKLQLFGEVLTELLENNHKALVFSQFVGHLHLLRDYLESRSIAYQYLDGSTSARDRKTRVDAFQAGEGDVFLISLKAGGTGLNLTAADYVIHMDPWWNPAVEDQASDRTHRIGQKRPVTIYRLVAQNTIEEKIVDLHKHKRDLADSLLEGADVSAKVSTSDLLRLIHEQPV